MLDDFEPRLAVVITQKQGISIIDGAHIQWGPQPSRLRSHVVPVVLWWIQSLEDLRGTMIIQSLVFDTQFYIF